ncbi:hypothetical protein PTT_04440 [Pyrenophora teres f. teres 0-1]|uniref:Uncharacterized protein n=1 Tax=Pyrenophora teres f. teres (strain 0-1) TaxID=861557 RepID=E3REH4_PYRTT|nr:hypothetical protein PTT_04440 [Pyrenophora teres f. teres 0-1]
MGNKSKLGNQAKKNKKTSRAKKSKVPAHLNFKEVEYDDEDAILDFNDLLSRTCRVWTDGNFDPNTMNGRTGSAFSNGHHDPDGGAKTRRAFSNGKFSFCLEWISVNFDGKSYRVRCQNQFTVRSNQCISHPKVVYKDGPNRVLNMLHRGETVTWGMIRDTERSGSLTHEQLMEKAQEEYDNLVLKARTFDLEEDPELAAEVAAKKKKKKKKKVFELKTAPINAEPVRETPQAPAVGTTFNARRGPSKSIPGNAILDAKAKRNPNNKWTRKARLDAYRGGSSPGSGVRQGVLLCREFAASR